MVTIHEKNARNFDTLGLGTLIPSSCIVSEELNGLYELEMIHPLDTDGKWMRIEQENIILASTPNGKQPFRIYHINPYMEGIKVNARHIFYDLLDNFCESISVKNGTAQNLLDAIKGAMLYEMPFAFDTDISLIDTASMTAVNPIQALLSDEDKVDSFAKLFGGELMRDGYRVSMQMAVGQDRDVAIRYGKNLVGLEVDEDISGVKTRIVCDNGIYREEHDSPYLDWDSVIDYLIWVVVCKGTDMVDKNYLVVTLDGTKWYFSAYDMDSTYGLNWDGTGLTRAVSNITFAGCASTHRAYCRQRI